MGGYFVCAAVWLPRGVLISEDVRFGRPGTHLVRPTIEVPKSLYSVDSPRNAQHLNMETLEWVYTGYPKQRRPAVPRDTLIGDMPSCAVPCIESDVSNTGCSSGDDACLCADIDFLQSSLTCAVESCSSDDAQTVANTINTVCNAALNAPHHGSGAQTRGDTATTTSSTTTSGPTSTVASSSEGTERHTSTSQPAPQNPTDNDTASITPASTATTSTADGDPQISTSSVSLTHSSFYTPTSERTATMISPSFTAQSSQAVSISSTAIAVTIRPSSTALSSSSTSTADVSTDKAGEGGHSRDLIIALSSVLGVSVLVASVLAYFLWNRRRQQVRRADASHENGRSEPHNSSSPEDEEGSEKGSSGSRNPAVVLDRDSSTIIGAYATTSLAGELGSPRSATSPPSFPSSPEVVSSQKMSDSLISADGTRGEPHSKHASHSTRGEPASSLRSTLPSLSQRVPNGLGSDEMEPREPWASDDREEEPPPYEPRTQE